MKSDRTLREGLKDESLVLETIVLTSWLMTRELAAILPTREDR